MTLPLPAFMEGTVTHYNRLRSANATRDRNHELIHAVRRGHIKQLFPAELDFSITFEGSPIANFVDIVAHDMAEGIAPLPSLACVSGAMKTDADQKRAEIKNRIGDFYWRKSRLEIQMLRAADQYVTYGFVPFFIEPDSKCKLPYIHAEDPRHSYYELDRFGSVKVYARRWLRRVDDLAAMFPEYAGIITKGDDDKTVPGDTELELVRWVDDTSVTLFLPQRKGLKLASYLHKMKCAPVVIAERPGDDDSPRGQFDDVIWVQVARAIMSTLALEAASLAVQAPIAVPEGMDEFAIGPHAILQSNDANQIHRVNVDVPATIFAEGQNLDNELRVGSRYPDARSGAVGASVITGKGVQALLGTFDSQIKGAQMVFKEAFQNATAMCFEMDELWWPNESKTVSGTLSGSSYEFNYTPAKDISGRYACTVTYGFAAGMLDPSQSIVTLLQLEGAGLIAKGTTQQNLPFDVDPMQERRKIDVEASREALKQGLFALVQASGQMAAQGQDPTPIIQLSVDVIRAIENGQPVEEAISQGFANMEQRQQEQAAQQAAAQQAQQGAQGGPEGSDMANGAPEAGVPGFQAPGQAGQPAGGRPTLEQMIAGFRGNGSLPVNQLEVRRSVPTGT